MWAKTRDTLLVVEPGTPAGYARIIALRDHLIALGAHVAAPCPHDGQCPLQPPDWCHFSQRLQRTRAHMQVKGAELPFEEQDEARGIPKLNPLADWSEAEVWAYLKRHDVPVNDLNGVVGGAESRRKLMTADGVHFTNGGSEKLGAAVAEFVVKRLPARAGK